MSKLTSTLLVFVVGGVLLTGASFFITRSGQTIYCMPQNTGPDDELSAPAEEAQDLHGFPVSYYRAEIPIQCSVYNLIAEPEFNNKIIEKDTGSAFYPLKLLLNVGVWGLFAVVILHLNMKRKSGKR